MIRENAPATKADLRELATKKELETIKKTMATKEELHELARITADGFATMATKKELEELGEKFGGLEQKMKVGFSLIMENLVPLRRDYEVLKDDLAPQVATLDARLTKVERKVGL